MLYSDEKELVVRTMKMFANTHKADELIKQTARYVSAKTTTWKRKLIYDYSRDHYTDKYKETAKDSYNFELDGKTEYWFCVLWYDGPRIFEDASETKIMVQTDELGILERFDIIHCSNDYYSDMVQSEDQRTFEEQGIKVEQVFMFYGSSKIIGNLVNKKAHPIYPWSDRLFETNPEWFI